MPALVINDLVKLHVKRAQDAHTNLQDEFQQSLDEINTKQVWSIWLISDFVPSCIGGTHKQKVARCMFVTAALHRMCCLLIRD